MEYKVGMVIESKNDIDVSMGDYVFMSERCFTKGVAYVIIDIGVEEDDEVVVVTNDIGFKHTLTIDFLEENFTTNQKEEQIMFIKSLEDIYLEDLIEKGQCFTKDKIYKIMRKCSDGVEVIDDMNDRHILNGDFYKEKFVVVEGMVVVSKRDMDIDGESTFTRGKAYEVITDHDFLDFDEQVVVIDDSDTIHIIGDDLEDEWFKENFTIVEE